MPINYRENHHLLAPSVTQSTPAAFKGTVSQKKKKTRINQGIAKGLKIKFDLSWFDVKWVRK